MTLPLTLRSSIRQQAIFDLFTNIMATPSVKIISTTIVHARTTMLNKTTPQVINITPYGINFLLVHPMQMGIVFTKPEQFQDIITLTNSLKTSLSTTLTFFPCLAGRLTTKSHEVDRDGTTVSYHVACNNLGALFVLAVAQGVTMADIKNSEHIFSDLFTLNGTRNCEGSRLPLLGVQVTELEDGVFIGCSMNHAVADGVSFWHFFNSWSEISRGLDQLSKPPLFEHKKLRDLCSDVQVRVQHSEIKHFSLDNMKEKIYHFSRKTIEKMKEKAKRETAEAQISSLQVILVHMWRAVIRYTRNLDIDSEITFILPIGIRQRINSLFPENYFGCATHCQFITMSVRELLEKSVGHVSLRLNKQVASYTKEECIGSLRSLIENPKAIILEPNAATINATFVTYNSPRFDVHGIDFGWGKPLAARSGYTEKGLCGNLTLYPGAEEGDINVEICVSSETLKAMESDPEFQEALTMN